MKKQLRRLSVNPQTGGIERGYVSIIEQDGQTFTTPIHRGVINPGDAVPEEEDDLIKELASIVHTPARVKKFKDDAKKRAE